MTRAIGLMLWVLSSALCLGEDRVDVDITPAMREYCHIIRFPQGWYTPPPPGFSVPPNGYDYGSKYEFRGTGLEGTKFLVAGVVLPYRQYTINKYFVELSDPRAKVLSASDEAWRSATPVALTQKLVPSSEVSPSRQKNTLDFRGFHLVKSGEVSLSNFVSPDDSWIVLTSFSGRSDTSDSPTSLSCFPFGCHGKIFWEIFDTRTGKKIVTVGGRYVSPSPDSIQDAASGWLTERYFIVALGEHRERCLVCEFGRTAGARP